MINDNDIDIINDNNVDNKELGGIAGIDVKLKMPKAFVACIQEIGVNEKYAKDFNEYCNNNFLQEMITTLDSDQDKYIEKLQNS